MRLVPLLSGLAFGLLSSVTCGYAAPCTNPDALGVSRVLVVDPTEHPHVGTMQYRETLPLKDHEVVLTFDDGPLPPYTPRILDILASQCVKATYFLVGQMAHTYPKLVRRIYAEGQTIGTHSQHHPFTFNRMTRDQVAAEVQGGIASVEGALGHGLKPAPFFRIPGLLRSKTVDDYLASQGLMTWSADFPADDWTHISDKEIVKRALKRLEAHGKGILLLHDIHPATALALPVLLHELKVRGYHIVQVVPATPDRPKTPTTPDQWFMHPPPKPPVPVLLDVSAAGVIPGLPISDHQVAGDHPLSTELLLPIGTKSRPMRGRRRHQGHAASLVWPATKPAAIGEGTPGEFALPLPDPKLFRDLIVDEPAKPARASEVMPVAHAQLAHIAEPRALPLPLVRPSPPRPVLAAQPAPPPEPESRHLLPAFIMHLWHRP